MSTTTQFNKFREELQAEIRSADKRTSHGKVVVEVALLLLDDDRACDIILDAAELGLGESETLRRWYSNGYDAGWDSGYSEGLGTINTPTESESND